MKSLTEFFVGVDLGQAQDYTAIAILEGGSAYTVRYLARMRGMTYSAIIDHIVSLMKSQVLNEARTSLIVDRTGVGAPVVDLLKERGLNPISITITGGDRPNNDEEGHWNIPKRDIISNLLILSQGDRLKIVGDLEEAETLAEEFQNLRAKIDIRTGHDSYEAWREGQHDDLVLATALATWWAEKRPMRLPHPICISTGHGRPTIIWPSFIGGILDDS
jgi:hypothetical protein